MGNLIEDFLKNKEKLPYPPEIQKGIYLHKAIDEFTDAHPVFREAKKIFQPVARLYSGAFVDVVMDYFLANDPKIKSETEWKLHSEKVYSALENHWEWLPISLKNILPKMKTDNWLYNYRHDWGMKYSLQHILNKAQYLDKETPVFQIFMDNKKSLQDYYNDFFPDLQQFANNFNLRN